MFWDYCLEIVVHREFVILLCCILLSMVNKTEKIVNNFLNILLAIFKGAYFSMMTKCYKTYVKWENSQVYFQIQTRKQGEKGIWKGKNHTNPPHLFPRIKKNIPESKDIKCERKMEAFLLTKSLGEGKFIIHSHPEKMFYVSTIKFIGDNNSKNVLSLPWKDIPEILTLHHMY